MMGDLPRAATYATAMNGLAHQEDLRLRFDVSTKTKQPELCRYWMQRDRAASVRLFQPASPVRVENPVVFELEVFR